MFKIDKMSTVLKEKLKASMSVVVTKSRKAEDHFEYFKEMADKIGHPELNVANKELIIELIRYIADSAKFEGFKNAKNNQNPE